MEQVQAVPALTLAELEADEKTLTQRRDAYVQEANNNVSAFNGAIQQVQSQKARLLEKQKGQEPSKKDGKRRRGKPAPKVQQVPVVAEDITEPGQLVEGG